jgi:CubicO group peptidase (beta-lactamase class C family)
MMLNQGELDGARVLSSPVAEYMVRDHMGPIAKGSPESPAWGLGFSLLKDPVAAGYIGNEGEFSHGGAAETYCWVDPKEQLVVVVMTQHMAAPNVGNLFAEMHSLVYGALTH